MQNLDNLAPVISGSGTDARRQCAICKKSLNPRRDNVIRHYRSHHNETLIEESKKFITIQSQLTTREQYIENIVEITVNNNLAFSVWNDRAMQLNQKGLSIAHGVTCSSRSMRDLLTKYSERVKERMTTELQDRRLCLKFDIASRKGRSILGIAAQFIDTWDQEIRYLAMTEIFGSATAENLRGIIDSTLAAYQLTVPNNVYAMTSDSGGNVLKASRMVLEEVDWSVNEEERQHMRDQIQQFELEQDGSDDEQEEDEDTQEMDDLPATEDSEDFDIDMDIANEPTQRSETTPASIAALHATLDAALRPYQVKETKCAAHVVQLAVGDFLKLKGRRGFLDELKNNVKEVRKYIRKLPPTATKPKMPILANDTRWGSSYDMVRI